MSIIRKAFRRIHYPIDTIALCVRWYLAYALSLRNIEEMIAERCITIDHSTQLCRNKEIKCIKVALHEPRH